MSRTRIEEVDGDVRFHHLRPGIWVLEARQCAHRWVVFHETYSFCLVDSDPNQPIVRWRYNHSVFQVDRDHLIMAMQPGELHSNVERTHRADFIVLQLTEEAMLNIAGKLDWGEGAPNIRSPHHQSTDPAFLLALQRFRAGLCTTLFDPRLGHCTCAVHDPRHAANLRQVVGAFLENCAEHRRGYVLPQRGAAFVKRAKARLYENYQEPFNLNRLARQVGCSSDYLLHCFTEELGTSPQDFHTGILVAKALNLIARNPRMPLSAVAAEIGWPGRGGDDGTDRARLLSRHLKRKLGAAPEAFRRDLELNFGA
jgi:AraC-like DNA-binding protein